MGGANFSGYEAYEDWADPYEWRGQEVSSDDSGGHGGAHDVEPHADERSLGAEAKVAVAAGEFELDGEGDRDGELVREVEDEGQWGRDEVAENVRRKRQDRNEKQEDEAGDKGLVAHVCHEVEEAVLQRPEDAGDDESDEKTEPGVSAVTDRRAELERRGAFGNLQIEDEQRHGDREDAVREGFDAVLGEHGSSPLGALSAATAVA